MSSTLVSFTSLWYAKTVSVRLEPRARRLCQLSNSQRVGRVRMFQGILQHASSVQHEGGCTSVQQRVWLTGVVQQVVDIAMFCVRSDLPIVSSTCF